MQNMYSSRTEIQPSATLKVAAKARELRLKGVDVIELGGGEPDFPTPVHIVEAAMDAIRKGMTKYTPSRGIVELREAIAEKYRREYQVSVDPVKEILVTPGAKQALFYAILATIEPGGEVLVFDPCWVSYEPIVQISEGRLVRIPTVEGNSFKPSFEDIERKISSRTRMLIICNPNNPTGALLSKNYLEKLAQLAEEHDLWILCDEIYDKIVFDNHPFTSLLLIKRQKRNKVIVVNGFSKSYAMTGWRLGYVVADAGLTDVMAKLQEHSATCPGSFIQYGGLAAIRGDQGIIGKMLIEYTRRRDYLVERISSLEPLSCSKPEGTFYLFANVTGLGENSEEIATRLLEKTGVTTTPGSAFGPGGEGYLRLSFAVPFPRLQEAMDRIENALQQGFGR